MAKRSQKDSGEERVTAKSRPMMNLIARTPSFVSSSTAVRPVKKYYDLIKAQIYFMLLIITSMSNSWKASLQQIIQNWITTVLGLLKSGKLRLRRTIDQGNLIKTSWRTVRQVRPDHEEILLDGTAQSVRNGETLRDRSGRPDNIISQEVARTQNSSWETMEQNWNCL